MPSVAVVIDASRVKQCLALIQICCAVLLFQCMCAAAQNLMHTSVIKRGDFLQIQKDTIIRWSHTLSYGTKGHRFISHRQASNKKNCQPSSKWVLFFNKRRLKAVTSSISKKAFDRVWHAALWATMLKYNISANLVRTIEQLYDKATSAVQMNGSIEEWFRTTVGVRQGCLLSPTLFNIFLKRIMSDALEEHDGKVSIGGRNITNLRFADDIDALAEEEQELEALVESLDKTCTRYKMEISAEKTKLMTNKANGIQREIKVKGQKLDTVTSFKYLGAVVSDDGSKPEVLSRIAQASAALTKLKPIWRDNNISLGSKVKLMRSLVISIFMYACESWTLTAELEKRMQAFEMRCYRRLLNISYKDHVTNEEVRRKIQAAIGEYDKLLTLVKKRKLRWFGHVSRSSGLAKTILQGTVKGKRKRGRQKKRWEDNIKEWTGMDFASSTRAAENRSRWKGIVANSSVVPRRPPKVMG